jgi:hypothetical protein
VDTSFQRRKKEFAHRFDRKFHVIFDEDSMIGCQTFAWLLHRLTQGHRGLTQDGLENDYDHLFPPQLVLRFAGGVPLFSTYGDIHLYQLAKSVYLIMCLVNSGLPMQRDASPFDFCLHLETDSGTVGVSVIMDQTICQIDPIFKGIIHSFRDGTVTKTQADITLKRRLSHLPSQESNDFCDNALYVMPTWARTILITVAYLKKNLKPVARCDIKYSHRVGQRNQCLAVLDENEITYDMIMKIGKGYETTQL